MAGNIERQSVPSDLWPSTAERARAVHDTGRTDFPEAEGQHWIRFGRKSYERIIDRRRSVVDFAPDSVFAFVRWVAGEHGTVVSRIDIVRPVRRGEPFQTLPFVRPDGDVLLRINGWRPMAWRHVQRVLAAIDAVDVLSVDPADASPDHWRHIHKPADRPSGAERLHARASCRMDRPPEDRPMTRFGYVMATYFAVLGVAVAAVIPTPTKLLWNVTASAPIGLYTIEPADRLTVPELVAAMAPEPIATFMVERGYIGRGAGA